MDALYIDQSNIYERNVQVTQIKDIYKRVQRVIVWLGPSADGSDRAMDLIKNIFIVSVQAQRAGTSSDVDAFLNRLEQDETSIIALNRLLRRDWWSRAWIIQEISTPRSQFYSTAI